MTETNVSQPNIETNPVKKFKPTKKVLAPVVLLALLAVLGFVLYKNKTAIVVAKVNNSYILRSQLNAEMEQRYGPTTLEDLITLTLVKNELAKAGIEVTQADMDTKTQEIVGTLGGMTLDDALKAQGMTKDAFNEQLKLQIGVEKVVQDKVTVTDQEIKDYVTKNDKTLTAKDAAGKTAEATDILKQQKLSSAISTWVSDLRTTAKITNYLYTQPKSTRTYN